MTLMSGKVYSDAGTPSNAIGEQGDIFMQLDGLKTTYRKEGGAWTPIGNQLGTIPEFLKGVGVPSNSLGANNQYYREVNTDAIYEKQAGVWTNIASWTSLGIQQLLQSNGIGADLATTNHVSNINTFIEAGAEGFYDNATTGTKPSTYGLVKAWRENSTHIYQKAETSDGKWATRKSSNGGATWPAWRIMANEDGDATRKFKALTGVDADDVAVVGQLPASLELFGSTYNYLATGETLTIPPLGVRRIVIIGGGGGTAGYETGDAQAGGESRLNVQGGSGTLVAKALGGNGEADGLGGPAGTPWQTENGRSGVEFNGDYLPLILPVSFNNPELVFLSKAVGYGEGGGRGYYPPNPNTIPSNIAGDGGVLEFLLKNNSPNIPLVLVATVGEGGLKAAGSAADNGAAGVIAYRS